jgi:molybdopterin converting factor small subunit
MEIEITVPGLLADCVGGRTSFPLSAKTLSDALRRMRDDYPLLKVHIYDEQEVLRRHVVIFYNERSIAWLPSLDVPLQAGDRIHVLQAVSGG